MSDVNEVGYEPLYDRVLVEILPDRELVSGGIYVPNAEVPFRRGRVVAVGCGFFQAGKMTAIDNEIKKGDVVIFAKKIGYVVKQDATGNPIEVVLNRTDLIAKEVSE